jgi:hypothetical protein
MSEDLDGPPDGKVMPTLDPTEAIHEDVLRRMEHAKWLREFAMVLGMTRPNSPPMTPFRQGAIAKLKLAARFIELQQRDIWQAKKGSANGSSEVADTGR